MPDRITYYSAHRRVWAAKGKARDHVCVRCGEQASDWAYTHDDPCPNEWTSPKGYKYSGDVDRYVPMCHPCHVDYDKVEITHCPQGHEYTVENSFMDGKARKCRTCVRAKNNEWRANNPMTPERHERRLEMQRIRRQREREARGAA